MPQESVPYRSYRLKQASTSTARINISGITGDLRLHGAHWPALQRRRQELLPEQLRNRNDQQLVHEEIKVLRNRLGKYWAVVTIELQQVEELTDEQQGVTAIDPGVRTFITHYNDHGRCGKIGELERVMHILFKADILLCESRSKSFKRKKCRARRRWRRQYLRRFQKVRNMVADVRRKAASYLCKTSRMVLLPTFETQEMLARSREGRRLRRMLSSKTCRRMATWSHYAFKQQLVATAQLYKYVKVYIVNEAYTSKTCGQCGHLHGTLGGRERFRCPEAACDMDCDRDYHAARNILLRALPHLLVQEE